MTSFQSMKKPIPGQCNKAKFKLFMQHIKPIKYALILHNILQIILNMDIMYLSIQYIVDITHLFHNILVLAKKHMILTHIHMCTHITDHV